MDYYTLQLVAMMYKLPQERTMEGGEKHELIGEVEDRSDLTLYHIVSATPLIYSSCHFLSVFQKLINFIY